MVRKTQTTIARNQPSTIEAYLEQQQGQDLLSRLSDNKNGLNERTGSS